MRPIRAVLALAAPTAVGAAATLALTLLPGLPAHAEEVSVPRGDGHRIVVDGRGYGHGHGMSQWGAQGAAREGVGYRRIVDFYYPGTSWGRASGTIAARITADTSSDVVVVRRRGLRVARVGGNAVALPARDTRRWRLLPRDGGTRVQWQARRRWRTWRTLDGAAEIWSRRGTTLVTPSGQTTYRGRLRAVSGLTVNVVSLEHYLRGVVPQEVPALWDPDAVRAQSVAARTYAAFERRSRSGSWDVYDTTASQVYGGKDAEHPAATDAIRHTAKQVLKHDGAPAFTQFSASSGGWTYAGSKPYLVTKKDPWDTWSGNPNRRWRARTADGVLERTYPGVGELRSIEVARGRRAFRRGGRAQRVTLSGTRGRVTVSGDDLRWSLGLKSTWFRLSRG